MKCRGRCAGHFLALLVAWSLMVPVRPAAAAPAGSPAGGAAPTRSGQPAKAVQPAQPAKPGQTAKRPAAQNNQTAPLYLIELAFDTARRQPVHRCIIIDRGGKVVAGPFEYPEVGKLADNRIPFQTDKPDARGQSLWGYLDATGKVAIEPKYIAAFPFSENRAMVSGRGGANGLIDENGNEVVPPKYERIFPFSEGLAVVFGGAGRSDLRGYIDLTGKLVIPASFAVAESFSEGLAAAWPVNPGGQPTTRPDGRVVRSFGYLDKTGRWAIKPQFESADSFHEGLARVSDDKGDWYINKTGRVMLRVPAGLRGEAFHSGMARVHDAQGKVGFINKSGKLVIPPRYAEEEVDDFNDGLAAFRVGQNLEQRWGFMDATGKTVIPPNYRLPNGSNRGYAESGDPYRHRGFYDTFEWVGGACKVGLADKRQALIDKKGSIIWQQS